MAWVFMKWALGSPHPVSDEKRILDIEGAPSATCWNVLEGCQCDTACPVAVPSLGICL